MTKIFTKKSVAYLFATILLFGFFSFNFASAANKNVETEANKKLYNKYSELIKNAPTSSFWSMLFTNDGVTSISIEPEDALKMTSGQLSTLQQLVSNRVNKIADSQEGVAKAQAVLDAATPEGIASAVVNFLFEMVLLPITSMCLAVTGKILNFVIQYSIYGEGFKSMASAIQTVWVLIRDTCNITFIFLLLYIAIQQVVSGSFKKDILVSIIIAAVLINFSLFVTRVVIDAGNMVATSLYNQIELTTAKPTAFSSGMVEGAAGKLAKEVAKSTTGAVTTITLSERLMSSLQIKSLWDQGFGFAGIQVGVAGILLSAIKLILMLITIYVFVFVSALLAGRFVMLIFLMAGSPIGFMGKTIPAFGGAADHWRKELTGQVLVAPIFMFFMLLIIKIGDVLTSINSKDQMILFFNYFIMMYLLVEAVKITKSFSGVIGGMADKLASSASGLALGLSAGAAGFIGRQTVGRKAQEDLDSQHGQNLIADSKLKGIKGLAARAELATLNKAAKSTFDFRNAKIGNKNVGQMMSSVAGLNLAGDNAKGGGVGGYTAFADQRKKEAVEQGKATDKAKAVYEERLIGEHVSDKLRQQEMALEDKIRDAKDPAERAKFDSKLKDVQNARITAQNNAKGATMTKINSADVDFSASEAKINSIKQLQEKLKQDIASGGLSGDDLAKAGKDLADANTNYEKAEFDHEVAEVYRDAQIALGGKYEKGSKLETLDKLSKAKLSIARNFRSKGWLSRANESNNLDVARTLEKDKTSDDKKREANIREKQKILAEERAKVDRDNAPPPSEPKTP